MNRLALVLALLALAPAGCRKPDARRPEAELGGRGEDLAGGFLVLEDRDTVATERYTRSPGHLRGTITHADGVRIGYDATVADDESIVRIELSLWRAGAALDSPPAEHSVAVLGGPARDSLVRTSGVRGPERITRETVPGGAQPYLIPSVALAQQVLRRARVLGGDSVAFSIVVLNGAALAQRVSVRWLPGDSALIGVAGSHVRVGFDAEGRIQDGTDPALGIAVKRLAPAK